MNYVVRTHAALRSSTAMRYLALSGVLLVTGLLLAAPPRIVEEIGGKVIGVTDGDTITVLADNKTIKVRLEGVDAPESNQSYGAKSKQALAELLFGKSVTVKKTGTDKYGRSLGIVIVGEVDANARMIEDGWAWHFKKYNDVERLAKLTVDPRKARRGLWADDSPLAPWEFRARQRTPQAGPKDRDANVKYWLNTSSGVRHNERCEHFQNTKNGRLCGAAEGRACGICGG